MKRSEIKTYGITRVSKILDISYATALRLAKRGELPCIRLGRQYLILRGPFEEMLKRPTVPPKDFAA
jgi:excisionase family DNA binding protein